MSSSVPAQGRLPWTIPAFTLVELLVVVGIIVVLVGVLLPSLAKARRAALAVACDANLHQIAMAVIGYADANGGAVQIQPILVPSARGSAIEYPQYYLNNIGPVIIDFDLRSGLLSPYLGTTTFGALNVWECPAAAAQNLLHPPLGNAALVGRYPVGSYEYGLLTNVCYGFNPYLQPPVAVAPTGVIIPRRNRLNQIPLPTRTMLCADSAVLDYYGDSIARSSEQTTPYGWYAGYPTFHGRHDSRGGVAWVDGHVTQEPVNLTIRSYTVQADASPYHRQQLGWLTPNARDAVADATADYYYLPVKGHP